MCYACIAILVLCDCSSQHASQSLAVLLLRVSNLQYHADPQLPLEQRDQHGRKVSGLDSLNRRVEGKLRSLRGTSQLENANK